MWMFGNSRRGASMWLGIVEDTVCRRVDLRRGIGEVIDRGGWFDETHRPRTHDSRRHGRAERGVLW
jgi:hypothetical protein